MGIRSLHADHYHPFLDETIGNSIDLFPAPGPEDFLAATNSFLKVIMTAIDSNGVTTEVFRDVHPRNVTVDIQTEPAGLEILVDEYMVLAPQEIVSWVNHQVLLRVQDQPPFLFQEWGDGSTSKTMNMTLRSNDEKAVVVARFCLARNSFCGKSWICCSGECNESGMCVGTSHNEYTDVPDEENVGNTSGDVATLPGDGNTVADSSVDNQSNNNIENPTDDDGLETSENILQNPMDDDGLETSEKWLLSLLTFVVIMFPFCMGLFYCRKGRSVRTEIISRSLDDSDDSESAAPITFVASGKESSSVTSAICEKLAEENERRSRLRAKLDSSNVASANETGTPETLADTPTSTESTSAALSTSIDDTLVRLDDILSRTFELSRSRRHEKLTKVNSDGVDESDTVVQRELDVERGYLDSFSNLLLPLGVSIAPESPLREDPANSFAVETVCFSFVSSGLEDGLNDSAVHVSDTHSVYSASGRLLRQEPTVPASLLDASGADSTIDFDFFPESSANADNQVNPESFRYNIANNMAVQDERESHYSWTDSHPETSHSEGYSLRQNLSQDVILESPNGDMGKESPSCNEDDSFDDKVESQQIKYKTSYSDDSASGHSLV
jgi:hypothetical protein